MSSKCKNMHVETWKHTALLYAIDASSVASTRYLLKLKGNG